MTTVTKKYWSDQELLALPEEGEIIDGEWVVSPAGAEHGVVVSNVLIALGVFVRNSRSGKLFEGQTGCRMKGGDVLCPDVSFVTMAHWQTHREKGKPFYEGSPDLAVEVLSPGDRLSMVERKVAQYLENGARLVWILDPRDASARAVRPSGDSKGERVQELNGEDVVPGFHMTLDDAFSL
jgi:Uma2 family endonuclease